MTDSNSSTENYNFSVDYFGGKYHKVKIQLSNLDCKDFIIFPTSRRFVDEGWENKYEISVIYEKLFQKYWGNNLFKYLVSSNIILDEEYCYPHGGEYTMLDVKNQKLSNTFPNYMGGKPSYDIDLYEKRITSFVWSDTMIDTYGIDVSSKRITISIKVGYNYWNQRFFIRLLESFICCDIDIRVLEKTYQEQLTGLNHLIEHEIPIEYKAYCNVAGEYPFSDNMGMMDYLDPTKVL